MLQSQTFYNRNFGSTDEHNYQINVDPFVAYFQSHILDEVILRNHQQIIQKSITVYKLVVSSKPSEKSKFLI